MISWTVRAMVWSAVHNHLYDRDPCDWGVPKVEKDVERIMPRCADCGEYAEWAMLTDYCSEIYLCRRHAEEDPAFLMHEKLRNSEEWVSLL